jgi:hypothetical protein
MTALVRSELRRATSRRLVRVLAGLGLLAAVVVGVVAFAQTSSADGHRIAAQQAEARRENNEAERAALECLATHADEMQQATSREAAPCTAPERRTVHDPRYSSHRAADLLKGTSGILALLAWVIGASLIGAEHQSRGLTTTLTFVPSRGRVFAAKAVAALAVAGAWAVVTLAAIGLGLLPTLIAHGSHAASDPTFWNVAAVVLRGAGLAGFAAAMGFAIASLGRSTAAALGVGFAYIMVIENILGSALRGWRPWMLLGNTIVWVSGHAQDEVPGRTVATAGLLLAGVAAALLAAGAAVFRSRDVA